jgi:acylphosphatase
MADKAIEARIIGRVQGVGFRAWAAGEARALGLTGWVRNEPDGSVAALLAGEETAVEAMLERLRRGPPAAIVEDFHARPAEAANLPSGFRILR